MATESLQRHTLMLESGGSASSEASAWARTLAQEAGLPEERVYAIDLCVVELVTNIVDHGYRKAPGGIRIDLELAPAAAILTLIDEAPAFDPLSVPTPAAPLSLDVAPVGGMGIQMVRSTTDRCRYERRGAHNVFTAWFGAAS